MQISDVDLNFCRHVRRLCSLKLKVEIERFMKAELEKYKKKLPLVALILICIVFLVWRPTFGDSTLSNGNPTLAEQHAQHLGEKTQPIHGIDVSHDQGDIDWVKVAGTDVSFVYLKATDGITYKDPRFDSHMAVLSQQRSAQGKNAQQNTNPKTLLYGAYHFFEAEDDPEKQAQNFIDRLSAYPFSLAPMVDVEVTKDQQPDVIQKRLKIFLDKVQSATGCSPVIYSYKSFWELNIGPSFDEYVFWLADYSQTMNAPAKVKNLVLWQYSEKGRVNGISGSVDLDVVIDGNDGLRRISCTTTINN